MKQHNDYIIINKILYIYMTPFQLCKKLETAQVEVYR